MICLGGDGDWSTVHGERNSFLPVSYSSAIVEEPGMKREGRYLLFHPLDHWAMGQGEEEGGQGIALLQSSGARDEGRPILEVSWGA